MKAAEVRELSVDELRAREKDLDDQLFRLRIQKSMGQLEAPAKVATLRRDLARIKTILRERDSSSDMSVKAQLTGTVVSDKMDKTVVVAVERQVRHDGLRQDPAQDVDVRRAQREQRGQAWRHGRHRRDRVRSAAASAGS